MIRRAVITGMGIVSPLGVGVDHNWSTISRGDSGIRAIEHFDVSDISSRIAGVVPRASYGDSGDHVFDPDSIMPPKEQKKVDVFIQYSLKAAQEALEDSGWMPSNEEEAERTGVIVGAGIGGLPKIYETSIVLKEKGPRRISPFFVPSALINLTSGQISIKYGLKGPNHSVVTACATGTHAIGDASRMVMLGDADVMVAGGAESTIDRIGIGGFAAARALSTGFNDRPTQASRPWDEDRDGFVIGEGSGIVIVEEYEHAKKRGAKIYGEVVGYGMSGDAHHVTAPAEDGSGGYRAMKAALKSAQINPEDIDYINAHGTSTPLGDGVECGAVKRLFENSLDKISMSSTKSSIGHLLGAAGAVEAIYTLKALNDNLLPPTLNLENISENCQGIDLVPKQAKDKELNTVLSNSFGFGGTNASLVFRKV